MLQGKVIRNRWSSHEKDVTLSEGEHLRLSHGDPLDILPTLKRDSIDICVCDIDKTPQALLNEIRRVLQKGLLVTYEEMPQLPVRQGEIILCLHMGSGRLAIESLEQERRYIGIEPSEAYKEACASVDAYLKKRMLITDETKSATMQDTDEASKSKTIEVKGVTLSKLF